MAAADAGGDILPAMLPSTTLLRPLITRARGAMTAVPGICAVCGDWPASRLCKDCERHFTPVKPRCGHCARTLSLPAPACGDCQGRLPRGGDDAPLDACVAAVSYGYPWDRLLAGFKYHGDPAWAGHLADVLRAAPGTAAELATADLLLPVPLAPSRLKERGFNQALLLARALRRGRSAPVLQPDWLRRAEGAAPQAGLTRRERLRNLRGRFTLAPEARVQGVRVLLVDDVLTTGATLQGLAQLLRQAGAARVAALVFARTEPPGG